MSYIKNSIKNKNVSLFLCLAIIIFLLVNNNMVFAAPMNDEETDSYGNKFYEIESGVSPISNALQLKTGEANADLSNLDSEKVIKKTMGKNNRTTLLVKNQTYDGVTPNDSRSKDEWYIEDLGYIRFVNAGSVGEQKLDVLVHIDKIKFNDWAGTASNQHQYNDTEEWLMFAELGTGFSISGSTGNLNSTEKKSVWFGLMEIYVTTEVVKSGTNELITGEKFFQVATDIDMNHEDNSASNTYGQFTKEGFATISGFSGTHYAYETVEWDYTSTGLGQMQFTASYGSPNYKGDDSFTKASVYVMSEGARFSSMYQEGDCGTVYSVYLQYAPQFEINKNADKTVAYDHGEKVTYTLDFKMGTWLFDTFHCYKELSITDVLPEGLKLESAVISSGSVGIMDTSTPNTCIYTFDEAWLQNKDNYDGSTYTLTIVAEVTGGTGATITNECEVKCVQGDDGILKDTDKAVITINEYEVIHKFVSGTPNKDLPLELINRTPDTQYGKEDGKTVTPDDTFDDSDYMESDSGGNPIGKWIFKGWDSDSATIDAADEDFIGTWIFEPYYKVTHEFVSGTQGKNLPTEIVNRTPDTQYGKEDGKTVTPDDTFDDSDYMESDSGGNPIGKWIFKGWDSDSATIDAADEDFIGTWIFEPEINKNPGAGVNNIYLIIMTAVVTVAGSVLLFYQKNKGIC